ncbi:MAG: hypothetical protein ACOCXH_14370 [Cyclobacteriaceae bacterium]
MNADKKISRILLYGLGEASHQDAALGIEFIDCMKPWIEQQKMEVNVHLAMNDHLQVEDAENLASHDLVIFVDASHENICDFYLSKIEPVEIAEEVTPAYLLHMCHQLYQQKPLAYYLHIRGYKWRDGELTLKAKNNLCKAVNYVQQKVMNPNPLVNLHPNSAIDLKK